MSGPAISSNPGAIASCRLTGSRLSPASTLCAHVWVPARRAQQLFPFPGRFATGQLRAGLQTCSCCRAEPSTASARAVRYLPPTHPDCHSAGTLLPPILACRARPAFCKATATTKPSALRRPSERVILWVGKPGTGETGAADPPALTGLLRSSLSRRRHCHSLPRPLPYAPATCSLTFSHLSSH